MNTTTGTTAAENGVPITTTGNRLSGLLVTRQSLIAARHAVSVLDGVERVWIVPTPKTFSAGDRYEMRVRLLPTAAHSTVGAAREAVVSVLLGG
jgi:hypothetical protein